MRTLLATLVLGLAGAALAVDEAADEARDVALSARRCYLQTT